MDKKSNMSGSYSGGYQPGKVIYLEMSTLYPPDFSPFIVKEKPLGCKTVNLQGLPEKATEEIIHEVFRRCGEILSIQMAEKSCAITFVNEKSVSNAICLTGYTIKIANRDESSFAGEIIVDHGPLEAINNECTQRFVQLEAQQSDHMEHESFSACAPSPQVGPFSDEAAAIICEKLKSHETFNEAIRVLNTWMQRGECNDCNSTIFYSLMEAANNRKKEMMCEMVEYFQKEKEAEIKMKENMKGILFQFGDIGKIMNAACSQSVLDSFSATQKESIEEFKRQTEELISNHVEEYFKDEAQHAHERFSTMENNTTLNLTDMNQLKETVTEICEKNSAISSHIESVKRASLINVSRSNMKLDSIKRKIAELECEANNEEVQSSQQAQSSDEATSKDLQASGNSSVPLNNEKTARLVGLISILLIKKPLGCTVSYISGFLHERKTIIQPKDVEEILQRFPNVFEKVNGTAEMWKLVVHKE